MKKIRIIMNNNDVHFINKEIDNIDYLIKEFGCYRWIKINDGKIILNTNNIVSIEDVTTTKK